MKGFYNEYPGIHPAVGHTLIIKGTGSLTASSNGKGAGIGGGYGIACGNIKIEGGTITATGGSNAAGIGSGSGDTCSDITISGGTVTATGGSNAAGIGSGYNADCGDIKITSGVTKVTATKGAGASNSIGKGAGGASCGTVTIGGTVYWNGLAYQNGGDTYLVKSTILYPVPAPIELSAVTSSQLGWIVGNDGKAYAVEPLPAGVDAVAKICYVGDKGEDAPNNHGLALALADEGQMNWSTAGTTCSGKNTSTPITGAKWLLASKDQWNYMINAAGGYTALRNGFSGIAGASNLQSDYYWSSTEVDVNGIDLVDSGYARYYDFKYSGNWSYVGKDTGYRVRACLAF